MREIKDEVSFFGEKVIEAAAKTGCTLPISWK